MMKIHVSHSIPTHTTEITFYEHRPDGRIFIAEPIDFIMKEYVEGTLSKPTLVISRMLTEDMLNAVKDCMDRHGIKSNNDHKIQGLLEATQYHLEDMRSLVLGKVNKNGFKQ